MSIFVIQRPCKTMNIKIDARNARTISFASGEDPRGGGYLGLIRVGRIPNFVF
jgi:hypothetical protein